MTNMSIAYLQNNFLSDLRQRKAAFDAFMQTARVAMPCADALYRRLTKKLAYEAVGHASSALYDNTMGVWRGLRDFALTAHPVMRDSGAWNRLACKKLLGPRLSRATLRAVARIRSAAEQARSGDQAVSP
jgi:ketopantoate reductase